MSFSFFKKRPSLSFVFDIRDASVSSAIAKFEPQKKPEIISCQNFEIKYRDPKNHKEYLSSMLKTLDEAFIFLKKELAKTGGEKEIGAPYFFVGSPWSVSQSKTIKVIKDKPFEINNDFLKKIIVGEELSAEKYLESQTEEKNWKILEERIIQSKLNGYRVDNIFGKKVLSFVAELFVSFVPQEIKEKLSFYSEKKSIKNVKSQNNSCILSSYTFFRDLYQDKNDFIYVDIGKLITDVYVVREDVIFGVASFPFGEENIIQASLTKTNLSKAVFMSHINIGQNKKFDMTSHNNGGDLLKAGFELWESNLKNSLSKLCNEINMPERLFFIPNSLIFGMLVKKISSKDNGGQFKILNSKIEVDTISEGVINSLISGGKSFMNEPYIKMDVVFLDKIFKQ